MTVYGGEKTVWGIRNGGFFVTCTKCGWHSKVEIVPTLSSFEPCVWFKCRQCNNEHYEEAVHRSKDAN